MAKKRTSKCNHPHVQALQQEIDRLKSTQGPQLVKLYGLSLIVGRVRRYPFRELAELLATAQFRAEPAKAGSMAFAGSHAKLGPTDSDGITVLGRCFGDGDECTSECRHVAVPGYSVPQRADQAILAETCRRIWACVEEVETLLDPGTPQRRDTSVRCGLSACEGRNRRQRPDSRFCAFCGRSFIEEEEEGAA